jgi:hypothetical protein
MGEIVIIVQFILVHAALSPTRERNVSFVSGAPNCKLAAAIDERCEPFGAIARSTH